MNNISEEIKNKKIEEIRQPLEELNRKLLNILNPKGGIKNPLGFYDFPLIDFTSVSHYNDNEIRTISRYRTNFNLKIYNEALFRFFEKEGFSFPDYESDNNQLSKSYHELKGNRTLERLEPTEFDYFDSERKPQKISLTNLDSWNYFVEKELSSKVKSCYTYFEKKNINEKNNEFIEIGIYLLCRKKIQKTLYKKINKTLSAFINQYGSSFILEELNERHNVIQELQKQSSLKSSLAAVMSRNMSHNVGSHVLNKLSNKEIVSNFFKMDSKKDYDGLFVDEIKNEWFTDKKVYKLSNQSKKEEVEKNTKPSELARVFNDYLKKRMDFVADVATSDRATLLGSKFLFKDVFTNFERNLLLVHNISGKEDKFKFQFDFKIVNKKGEKDFYDPIVAMPNDVLGSQAFYIILENIIRNTAKHSGVKFIKGEYEEVTFTIKVDDDAFSEFYVVSVYDDIAWEKVKDDKTKTGVDKLNTFIKERNESIASDVLDPKTNQIRKNGWGTIELKIAACYLSRVSTLKIDDFEYSPLCYKDEDKEFEKWDATNKKYRRQKTTGRIAIPILEAVGGFNNKRDKGFGYKFLIKKPKEVLILDGTKHLKAYSYKSEQSKEYKNNRKNRKALNKLGVNVNSKIKADTTYNHNILIVISESSKNLKELFYNMFLPQRQLIINTDGEVLAIDGKTLVNPLKIESSLDEILKNSIDSESCIELSNLYWRVYENTFKGDNEIDISKPKGINLGVLSDKDLKKSKGLNKSLVFMFDHHGTSGKGNHSYYEPFGSSSIFSNFLSSIEEVLEKEKEKHDLSKFIGPTLTDKIEGILEKIRLEPKSKLLQAGLTRVLIIDERIQGVLKNDGFVSEDGKGKFEYEDMFKWSNILVPSTKSINQFKKIDLNDTNLKQFRKDILQFLASESINQDYVVIHFGILESIRDDKHNLNSIIAILKSIFGIKLERYEEEFFNKNHKKINKEYLNIENPNNNNKAKLIITSGRGLTPDIEELNLPFVSYSAFSNFVVDPNNRSKLHLTELLKSIRS